MTFAMSHCRFSVLRPDGPSTLRAIQRCYFHIQRGTADTALDLNNTAGTFWTAAKADATSGPAATRAATAYDLIRGKILNLESYGLTSDAGIAQPLAFPESGTLTGNIWATTASALAADSAAQTFTFSVQDGLCTLGIPAYAAAAKGASPGAVIVLKTALIAKYRPAADVAFPIRVQDNSAFGATAGLVVIKSTGIIEIYKDATKAAAYTITNNIGPDAFAVTYPIAYASPQAFQISNAGAYPAVDPSITLAAAATPTDLKLTLYFALIGNQDGVVFDY